MPVGRQFDILIDGNGYMLARPALLIANGYQGRGRPRAWHRSGQPNAIQPKATDADLQRNSLPPEIDFVAAYDDFSGGYGNAYRDPANPAGIHWAQNMEVRFPRQATHCQRLYSTDTASTPTGSLNDTTYRGFALDGLLQVPAAQDSTRITIEGPVGRGSVFGVGHLRFDASTNNLGASYGAYWVTWTPTGLGVPGTPPYPFDRTVGLDVSTTVAARMAGRPAIFGSFAWVGGSPRGSGADPRFWRRDMTGLPYAAATQAPINGYTFTVAGNRMWKAAGPSGGHINLLQSIAIGNDPMSGSNWGPTFNLGNGLTDVQDMLALNDQVFASMQDGLYAGDTTGTFFNVIGDMAQPIHPDNGRQLCVHDLAIIYPHAGGLIAYEQTSIGAVAQEIGPDPSSLRSPLRGRFRSVTSFAGWLYAGLFTGSSSHIIVGRQGQNGYVWHPMHRIDDVLTQASGAAKPAVVNQVFFDSIASPSGGGFAASGNNFLPPRMWVTTAESSLSANFSDGPTFYAAVPPGDQNPLGFPGFIPDFVGSASIYFGRDNRGAPETKKVLRRVDVNTDVNSLQAQGNASINLATCDVYYALDGGDRTFLGTAASSPKTTLFFPANQGSFVTCYDFELSVDSFVISSRIDNVNQTGPVYRSFEVHGAFLTEGSDEIVAVLDIADGRVDRGGVPMRSAAAQITELRGLAGGGPVQLIDLTGAQNWVTVNRAIDEQEQYQEGQSDPELLATVRMSVLTFS